MSRERERSVILWQRPSLENDRLLPRLIELEEVRAGDVFQLVPIDDEDAKTPNTFGLSRAKHDARRTTRNEDGSPGLVIAYGEPWEAPKGEEDHIERAVNRAIAETAREDGDSDTITKLARKLYQYLGIESS